jgi:hypothetical protein
MSVTRISRLLASKLASCFIHASRSKGKKSVVLSLALDSVDKHLGITKTDIVSLVGPSSSANRYPRHIPQLRQGIGCIR